MGIITEIKLVPPEMPLWVLKEALFETLKEVKFNQDAGVKLSEIKELTESLLNNVNLNKPDNYIITRNEIEQIEEQLPNWDQAVLRFKIYNSYRKVTHPENYV